MRWVGRILGGLLALVLVVYLGVNLYSWFATRHHKNAAKERLTEQLATALPAARDHQNALAEVLGRPEHSWLAQRCEVETDDSGWMVQSYRQECLLETIDAYAAGSLAEARRLIAPAPADLVGEPTHAEASGGCQPLRERSGPPTRDPGQVSLSAVFVGPQSAATEYWCGSGYQPNRFHPEQVVGGDHVTLDASRSWLIVRRGEQLGGDSIGCMHWSVLFCDEPSGLPVFGQAPGT